MKRYLVSLSDFHNLITKLMKNNDISAVLSGKEKGNRYTLEPEYISDQSKIINFPLSQLLVYGFARIDSPASSILHSARALTEKIAVVGHACDIRALVETQKKKQLVWENLFLIGFDDIGYIEVGTMMKFLKKEKIDASQIIGERLSPKYLLLKFKDGTSKKIELGTDINVSDNCSRCIQKDHPLADFLISTYSLNLESNDYILTPQNDRSERLISTLKWENKLLPESQNQLYDQEHSYVLNFCSEKREKELIQFEKDKSHIPALMKCTGCGLCVKACPVCFCPDCGLIAEFKAKRMDKLTFVMTKIAHVGDTCVECGKCNSNCPMNIPLSLIFQSLRRKFKTQRNYNAGADLNSSVIHLNIS